MPKIVDRALIDHLYQVPKRCPGVVQWRPNPSRKPPAVGYMFQMDVICEDGTLLEWRGWIGIKTVKPPTWGFALSYRGRYIVRSWDMGTAHKCLVWGGTIRGKGRHKHYYHSEEHPRAIYEIPRDEISIEDPNEAVLDFAAECSIKLQTYQRTLLF